MSKERAPRSKILSHSAVALSGVAVGYLVQQRKLNQVRRANQASKFDILRLKGDVDRAGIDEVTGLPRREAIYETYEKLVSAAKRRKRSGEQFDDPKADKHSFLLLDLDHFKSINDSQGHNKGDEILRLVADTVTSRLRERDVIARWGGEEIGVLLPRATEIEAVNVAEELKEYVEATGQVTASFGVAEMALSRPMDDSVALADQALYAAKAGGRNQVVAYSSLLPVS